MGSPGEQTDINMHVDNWVVILITTGMCMGMLALVGLVLAGIVLYRLREPTMNSVYKEIGTIRLILLILHIATQYAWWIFDLVQTYTKTPWMDKSVWYRIRLPCQCLLWWNIVWLLVPARINTMRYVITRRQEFASGIVRVTTDCNMFYTLTQVGLLILTTMITWSIFRRAITPSGVMDAHYAVELYMIYILISGIFIYSMSCAMLVLAGRLVDSTPTRVYPLPRASEWIPPLVLMILAITGIEAVHMADETSRVVLDRVVASTTASQLFAMVNCFWWCGLYIDSFNHIP
jgi:hypothetical protein